MPSLSEINKNEREILKVIDNLKKDYREGLISKSAFEKAIKENQSKLGELGSQKVTLTGPVKTKPKTSVPKGMPLPPPPPRQGLPDIKKAVLESKTGKAERGPEMKPVKLPEPKGKPKIIKSKPLPKLEPPKLLKIEVPKLPKTLKPPMPPQPPKLPKLKAEMPSKPPEKAEIKKPKPPARPRLERIKEITKIKEVRIPTVKIDLKKLEGDSIKDMKRSLDTHAKGIKSLEERFNQFSDILKKEGERITQTESNIRELLGLKERFDAINFKELSRDIYDQFQRMNSSIKEAEENQFKQIEEFKARISSLENSLLETRKMEERMEGMDLAGLRRDIETLRKKSQWTQDKLEDLSIQPLVESVKAMENKLGNLKSTSALVIE